MLTKVLHHRDDVKIINICKHNRAPKYEAKWKELKRDIDSSIILVGDYNIPFQKRLECPDRRSKGNKRFEQQYKSIRLKRHIQKILPDNIRVRILRWPWNILQGRLYIRPQNNSRYILKNKNHTKFFHWPKWEWCWKSITERTLENSQRWNN